MLSYFCILVAIGVTLADSVNFSGLHELVQRRFPNHAKAFTFHHTYGDGDSFIVSNTHRKKRGITITCTTTSACARGLYS